MIKRRSASQIFSDVIFALMLREFQTRFGARRMGAFWMLFEPAIHVGIMLFLFTVVRARSLPGIDYAVFLVLGLVPFFLFRNLSQNIMNSVNANQALFAYPNIKILDTFIARVLVEIMIYSIILFAFVFVLGFWADLDVSIARPLSFITYIILGILFSFGLGSLLCSLIREFPNLKTFVSVFFMAMYFSSGVIFPLWVIPEPYLGYVMYNPYAQIVNGIRESAMLQYPHINGASFTYTLETSMTMLCIGLAAYRITKERLLMK